MKTFFGGMFMNKEALRKEGILHPIKLEYYKIKDIKSKNDIFGVEIVKTEYLDEKVKVRTEKDYIEIEFMYEVKESIGIKERIVF